MEEMADEVLAYYGLPETHRQKMRMRIGAACNLASLQAEKKLHKILDLAHPESGAQV